MHRSSHALAMSVANSDAQDVDCEPKIVSKGLANIYRKELATQRGKYGTGDPLDDAQMVTRLVSLRRRNVAMAAHRRSSDKKVLEQLERALPSHVTTEADRVIGALTSEIRAVGDSVVAVRGEVRDARHEAREARQEARVDLQSLALGELPLKPGASRAEERAALSIAQATISARKRALAQADRDDRQRAAEERAMVRSSSSRGRSSSVSSARPVALKRDQSESGHAPAEKKVRGSRKPKLAEETRESLSLFMCDLGRKDASDTWARKFACDSKKETGMTVRARLGREDHRRRFLSDMAMSMPFGGGRDSVMAAFGDVEGRRRALLGLMSYDEQVVYNNELEKREAERNDVVPVHPAPASGLAEQTAVGSEEMVL